MDIEEVSEGGKRKKEEKGLRGPRNDAMSFSKDITMYKANVIYWAGQDQTMHKKCT